MRKERPVRRGLFLIAVAAFAATAMLVDFRECRAAANGHVSIGVLISHKEDPYGAVVSGFHKALTAQKFVPHYHTYPLGGDAEKLARAVRDIRKEKPDLLLALGTFAVEGTIREVTDIPIVAGLFLRPDELRKAPNATGVYLEFSLHTQFRWMARMLPYARTVGVLYNPSENQKRVDAADRTAEIYGFRFQALPVKLPRDIPDALDSLVKTSDVLWGLNDTVALTPETAKNFFLLSFRTRIPFVGLSAAWVKAGAFYALEWDFVDLGAQCGEMAGIVLRGGDPAKIPPSPPRKATLALNLKTAKLLGIQVPEGIVSSAVQVFQGGE